jgi:hypothetical protein
MTGRTVVAVLLQISQFKVKLERLLLVDALGMQQRYATIGTPILQLLPAILRPYHITDTVRADCFDAVGTAGLPLAQAPRIASASIAL